MSSTNIEISLDQVHALIDLLKTAKDKGILIIDDEDHPLAYWADMLEDLAAPMAQAGFDTSALHSFCS